MTVTLADLPTGFTACWIFRAKFWARHRRNWPRYRAIGLVRRGMDILRAVPEIVIALVLIFVLGGGPVPAMIAIALHTVGALGKLFSEVNENAPQAG